MKPNLLNADSFGGHLIAELPSLPVSMDGRATPYVKFQEEESAARRNTTSFDAFLRRWNINLVMEKIPGTTYHAQAGFLDNSRLLLPASD